jgi:protein-S-isoprenylcysteine O-methyltransferase Ste14
LLLIRFVLLSILDKDSLKRAAFFAPVIGKEKVAYWFYQISNIFFFIYLFFIKITTDYVWLYVGLGLYGFGIILCIWSVLNFAKPAQNGINLKGIYRISRNPMYIAYFVCFFGCVLLTRSFILFAILFVFQISAHWIILSEERWCAKEFGEEYIDYMKKVRRYI